MTDLMTTPSPAPSTTTEVRPRLDSVDVVRGVVMIVMVLDHVRDFSPIVRVDPTNLAQTTPALFFTRWITHFCAPTFVLLAGVGASLAGSRGMSRGVLARFLLARGAWLIVLEETWVNAWVFFSAPTMVLATILWAIGWSMIALAGLIYLPRVAVASIGILMIAGHDLLDGVVVDGNGPWALLWRILHGRGIVAPPWGPPVLVGFPLVPWVGVMAAGYALGPVLLLPHDRRRPILLGLGIGLTAAFVALRLLNAYGDPTPWSIRPSPTFTVLSFLNCQKYPPSLMFLLMTLGPTIAALGLLDRGAGRWAEPLRTFGRVPLFFYLIHWPLAHGLAFAAAGFGEGLAMVYVVWPVVLALVYGPCRWFAGVKRRHRWAWLSYL